MAFRNADEKEGRYLLSGGATLSKGPDLQNYRGGLGMDAVRRRAVRSGNTRFRWDGRAARPGAVAHGPPARDHWGLDYVCPANPLSPFFAREQGVATALQCGVLISERSRHANVHSA